MSQTVRIRALINRLARLDAAQTRIDDLNPTQLAALDYLSRANRFSRAPSQVADYFGTTRGTMSQTLKALERKGHIRELRSEIDRRSISYHLTATGTAIAARSGMLQGAIAALDPQERSRLESNLFGLLKGCLDRNGGRSFGLCKTCKHHRTQAGGAYCALMSVALEPAEAELICHEQIPA